MLKRMSVPVVLVHLLCIGAFLLVCVLTGPENFRAPHALLPDLQDSVLAMALMSWPAQCLQSPQCSIADFPIFYPEQGALFFTDSLIGIGLIFNSLKLFLGDQLSYNLTLLVLSCLNFYSFFLLMRFARIRYFAAFLASTAFAAMPYVLQFGSHIQLYNLFLWPLSLLLCLKLVESRRSGWLYGLSVALALTFYLSMSIAIKQFFFVGLALAIALVGSGGIAFRHLRRRRWIKSLLGSVVLGAVMLTPLAYQYVQVRKAHPFVRDIQESSAFSLDLLAIPGYLASFVVPADVLASWGLSADRLQKYSDLVLGGITPWLALGVVFIALAVFRASKSVWLPNSRIHQLLWIAIISMVVSILLMLGPSLVIAGEVTDVPSLYQVLYYVVPGFKALRVPVRFVVPLVIYASILMGIGLDGLFRLLRHQVPHQQRLTAFVLAAVLIMAFVVDRSSFVYYGRAAAWTPDAVPAAYDVVKANPGAPVLELPMWPPSRKTFKYFYYQMQDWNPRVSGISSFFPESFYALRHQMNACPSSDCFAALQKSPADILVVHLSSLGPKKRALWRKVDLNAYGFRLQPQSDRRALVWLRDAHSES